MNFREIKTVEDEWSTLDEIVSSGGMNFLEASLDDLEPFGRSIIWFYLKGTKWQLGDVAVQREGQLPAYVLKIANPWMVYLDIHPSTKQFLWLVDQKHSESCHPDQAMAYLMGTLMPGVNATARIDKDGKSSLIAEVDGFNVQVSDDRTYTDRRNNV